MAKITEFDPRLKQAGRRPGQKGPGADKADFNRALQEAQAGQSESTDKVSLGQPAAPPSIYGPPPAVSAEALIQTEAELAAERTVDLLDSYQAALANPTRTLKSMAPLVQEIEAEVTRIQKSLEDLPPDDRLRPLLNQVAVTAMVETIKFNRGDYI